MLGRDGSDVCSGVEKRRLALSRLFYRWPRLAVLDEYSSSGSDRSAAAIGVCAFGRQV